MDFTLKKLEKRLPELWDTVARDIRDIPNFRFHIGDAPGAQHPDFDNSG
jgi:hypothetical protein